MDYPIIRGDKGDDVRAVQQRLIAHGARIAADGIFGPASEAALASFQGTHGLPARGRLDEATWAELERSPILLDSAGLVIAGARVFVANVDVVTWLDDPKIPRVKDGHPRAANAAKAIVLHTVHGKVGPLSDRAAPPSSRAENYARYQASTTRDVSWHLTIDTDGTVVQSADVATWTCWHATSINAWTVGIELVQDGDGTVYASQLATVVAVCDVLCARLGIERRVPAKGGVPIAGVVERLTGKHGAWSGVLGHRNQTTNRGKGDPGDHVFRALLAAGYAGVEP